MEKYTYAEKVFEKIKAIAVYNTKIKSFIDKDSTPSYFLNNDCTLESITLSYCTDGCYVTHTLVIRNNGVFYKKSEDLHSGRKLTEEQLVEYNDFDDFLKM